MSLRELMEQKRKNTEAMLEKKQTIGPSEAEKEERKARLQAQRDLLRKQKEDKRQKEL